MRALAILLLLGGLAAADQPRAPRPPPPRPDVRIGRVTHDVESKHDDRGVLVDPPNRNRYLLCYTRALDAFGMPPMFEAIYKVVLEIDRRGRGIATLTPATDVGTPAEHAAACIKRELAKTSFAAGQARTARFDLMMTLH